MKLLHSPAHRSPHADVAFFAGWPAADLERFERVADIAEYEPGDLVTYEGQLALEFVVVLCGRATVLQDGRPVGAVAGGETIGELSMLSGTPSTVTAVAQTYLKALVLGPREFNGLLWEAPALGRRLATQLAGRLGQRPAAVGGGCGI